ncbi:MAG: PKD domain-containing protein [Rhodospirillaceae bacterium]|nr:PKD domain-containing protein [Rhodospirillaceae bacterium]
MTDYVRVSGTLSGDDCTPISLGNASIHIIVSVDCGGGVVEAGAQSVNGFWTVDVKLNCNCNEQIIVTARCATNPDCKDIFTGVLPCPTPECPAVDVDVQIGDCNPDGTRSVTLVINVTAMGAAATVVAEWDYGDGLTGSAFVINGVGTYIEGPHNYDTSGPVTAQLNYVIPDCPPFLVDIDFSQVEICPGPSCPEISSVAVAASAVCNSDGSRTVTFNASITGGTAQTYHWEFGTPDSASSTVDATNPGVMPTATHDYPAPGSGDSNYTATLTVTGIDPLCVDTTPIPITVSGCGGDCPTIDDITASVGDCQDDGTRPVSLTAAVTGGGVEQYQWSFGDGTTTTIDATVVGDPSTNHDYQAPGNYSATLTTTGPQSCENQSRSININIPSCEIIDDDRWCAGLIFIVIALLSVATVATILLLGLTVCPAFAAIVVPGWAWGIIAGLWIAAGLALLIWIGLCLFGICDCPTKCDWLTIIWATALSGAIIALYLAGCCDPAWWFLVGGLGLAFIVPFAYWLANCEPSLCTVLDFLLIVFGTVAATALAYIALVPIILACAFTWVAVSVTAIVAVLAVAVPLCHASEAN